jgi:sporulation protein YlmC with PRC-barrel domain
MAGAVAVAAEKPDGAAGASRDFSPQLLKVDWLLGHAVAGQGGKEIGTLQDIVFDANLDTVGYAVITHGGVLGVGATYHAVPWHVLTIDESAKTVSLPVDAKVLEGAPSFDTDHWPDMSQGRWWDDTRQYWDRHLSTDVKSGAAVAGREAEGKAAKAEGKVDEARVPSDLRGEMAPGGRYFQYRRASETIGMSVKNPQKEDLGDIDNLILDTREGRLVYAYISFGGLLGLGDKIAAVPWSAVQIRPRMGVCLIEADKNLLEAIAFEQGKDPKLTDTKAAADLHARFNQEPYWTVFGYAPSDGAGMRKTSPDAWMPNSKYNATFDPKTVVESKGTIEGVSTFQPAPDAPYGLRLKVKTDQGAVTLHAGPRSYAAAKGLQFRYGDTITFKASRTKIDGKTVMMGVEIAKGEQKLELRDAGSGAPKWEAKDLK